MFLSFPDSDDDESHLRQNPLTSSISELAAARTGLLNSLTPAGHQLLARQQQHFMNGADSRKSEVVSSSSPSSSSTGKETQAPSSPNSTNNNSSGSQNKPKIWSMAEIATSSSKTDSPGNNNNNTTTSNSHSPSSLHNKLPSIISQGLHPAWRGAHPYLHPHFSHRLASFPPSQQLQQRHMALPGLTVTSLPQQLRHVDSANRVSAFSPPASATNSTPSSTQAQRTV